MLLTPTRIYVRPMLALLRTGRVKAVAHITGGGLCENVPRVLPDHLVAQLDASRWTVPQLFAWMATAGQVGAVYFFFHSHREQGSPRLHLEPKCKIRGHARTGINGNTV